jgi:U3 small nucleolar ribonucleoprotein protein IMP3
MFPIIFLSILVNLISHLPFRYNALSRKIRNLAEKIANVDQRHPFRTEVSTQFLEKLCIMGLIPTKWDLEHATKISASTFCRRRLPVVMVRNKMSESIKNASLLVEQGHVRIGTEIVKDPAYLITRTMEDFVTWTESSKIREHVLEYNDNKDDFELL